MFIKSWLEPMNWLALWIRTSFVMRSMTKRLMSLMNSFMVVRLPMCFLTRSKKARSSWLAREGGVGLRGSGITGVRVGSIDGPSATGLCESLARLLLVDAAGRVVRRPEVWISAPGPAVAGADLSGRGRFLLSFVALAGGAKFPTGGILGPSRAGWPGCGVGVAALSPISSMRAALADLVWAADSGKNCLKSSRRSGAA